MRNNHLLLWILVLAFAVLASIPWLIPHTGAVALIAFIPLLFAEDIATQLKIRHFWIWHYSAFVLWNAFTTFWVCNATVGGGIFAVMANALQMSVIFGIFRLSRRRFSGVVPYILLAAAWIAWEHLYFNAQISWPWLTLGNAFAQTTRLVQWYEYTGSLGGSLWIWAANLGIYGIFVALADGCWQRWNHLGRISAAVAITLVIGGPVLASFAIYNRYEEKSEGTVDVLIGQPNFDPYHKFEAMTQAQQTRCLLDLYDEALESRTDSSALLLLAPETFTSDILLDDVNASATVQSFREFLARHKGCELLFGASTYDVYTTHAAPTLLAYPRGYGWLVSHNSALITDAEGNHDIYHKSKLVVGTELTPYPKLFVKLDNLICSIFKINGPLMGRCVGQDGVSLLHFNGDVPIGCAVCYESVYGEYCTGYVRKGAKAMTVITNDAWWGNTPGYRQHFSYSRLRAIELRRDFARCGNTGLSAVIDQRGDVLTCGPWWEPCTLRGTVNLNSEQTFFSRYGDMTGRICVFVFLLLAALLIVRLLIPADKRR